ncbi:MAG: GNAT family N-acetyltransferase [Candidatus Omnitrophica bacterium]|nr:GNAT family N-acetyltransferase [Candidatus Omnitrophota bacterium]
MELKIRKSTIDDLEQIQKIACRTIDINYRSFLGDKGVDWFIESGAAEQYLQDNIVDCWVLESDNKIIAFCVCKGSLLDLIMVETEFHRKGYGSELLKYCEQVMFSYFEEIKLESFERNEKANNFYRKHGWIQKEKIFDKASNAYKLIFTKHNA